jgi:hypothetical protein
MTTDLEIGRRYEKPAGEPASWFGDVLSELRGKREGEIPIRLEASTGHRVDGLLTELDPAISPGPNGKIALNSHGDDLVIGSEMVSAFTLLPGDTPVREEDSDD